MPSFYIQQFGCRATQADGAAIERQLLERGCALAPSPNAAEIIVVNTCTVTASADAQARDAIRKIHARNPAARVIVTGCYAQRAPEELASLPGVSFVVGNSHKPQIPDVALNSYSVGAQHVAPQSLPTATLFSNGLSLADPSPARKWAAPFRIRGNAPPQLPPILTGDIFKVSDVLVAPVFGSESHHTRPTLKIQDGCNSRCSFCVIPFVRGKSRSLPPGAVIAELNRLASSGFREIVLSGINLGSWGRDLSPRSHFLDLLKKILDETAVERLRISSIEPLDVTRDLISLFASSHRLAEHFHMPLQSGSDLILSAMHRWYRTEHYARRLELIREQLPHAAIGADVIAGFPGETETDHAATLAFIERLPFTYLHVFSYSSRPGTRAASLQDHLPSHNIKRRARELRSLGESKSSAFRRSQIGRTLRVLTLHRDEDDVSEGCTPALSSNYLRVRLDGVLDPNEWADARLSAEHSQSLLGVRIRRLAS
jgi:threonylcarbamoyladenosine tRNA methylthiotransferase MtaB